MSTILGRPVEHQPITFERQKKAMVAAGLPPEVAEDNARAVHLFAEGDAGYVTDDVPTLLARPARSFEQFVADHRAAFS